MKNMPIQKLNKRLIYLCLVGAVVVAVPLIVIPMTHTNAKGEEMNHPISAQVFMGNSDDAFALSGTERFPKNYGTVKEFEHELAKSDLPQEDPLTKALDPRETTQRIRVLPTNDDGYVGEHYVQENPWQEARKAEQKRRAFEHFDSRRSDILFADKGQRVNVETSVKRTDSLMNAVERSLELAENHLNQNAPKNDLFFARDGQAPNKGPIGQIKDAVPHMISEGTLIPCILLTEIDTSLPGPILARVSHNIWDSKTGQSLLIPQNSQLIGEYESTVGHGQTRAQIVWKRIIFPNQQSVNLGSMVGVDKRGTSGTSGAVDNHYDKVALGLLLTTALGGSVRMAQGKYDPNTASVSQEFGNSLAQETARLGNKITDKMLSIPPTIKVPMGQRLNVFVEQDLSLQPYAG